jgi:hypothetical protein
MAADSPPKGFLNESEFYVALRLVAAAQAGKEVSKQNATSFSMSFAFIQYPNVLQYN